MLKIKKGDTVRVIAGKDKGKEGKVLSVADGKVVVEGVNTVTKHTKASQANPQGGIVTKEAALDASNVMYVHKGKVTRIAKKSEYYDAYPLLLEAFKNNRLSDKITVHCLGGEPAILKETSKILKLFIKNGLKHVSCVTSGINYIKEMETIFEKFDGQITISLDSGTRETYKKIKRVDKFNDVIKNIKKYIKATNGTKNSIMVKYILTENYNDNHKEIDSFFKILLNLGLKQTRIDIDYRKTCIGIHEEIPEHFSELYEYFKERANFYGIALNQYNIMDKIFKEKHY